MADKEVEVIKGIHLQKEADEVAIVRNENDNLREELERLRKKYESVKSHAAKMSGDMKVEREGIIDSLVRLRALESQQAEFQSDSPSQGLAYLQYMFSFGYLSVAKLWLKFDAKIRIIKGSATESEKSTKFTRFTLTSAKPG